jgi:hypothetical protein
MPVEDAPQSTSGVASPAEPSLSPEQQAQLATAQKQLDEILNAAHFARNEFLGQTSFGVITAIWPVIFPPIDPSVLVMGVWMVAGGLVERMGEKRIRQLSAKIFNLLTLNQILLGAMFSVIGCWWVFEVHNGWDNADVLETKKYFHPIVYANQLLGQSVSDAQVTHWAKWALYIAYGSVVVFGFGWQGFMACYYAWRGRQMAKYLKVTPDWIIQRQRNAAPANSSNKADTNPFQLR